MGSHPRRRRACVVVASGKVVESGEDVERTRTDSLQRHGANFRPVRDRSYEWPLRHCSGESGFRGLPEDVGVSM